MKKRAIFTILLINTYLFAEAQSSPEFIDKNNVKAAIHPNGCLFFEEGPPPLNIGKPSFEVPIGSGKHLVYTAGLWAGGKIGSGHVKSAVQWFYEYSDYTAGPVANEYDNMYESKYNRLWKISKDDIMQFRKNWQSPGYVIPEVIQNWPGNGLVSNGEAAQLAPYVDRNNNGIYEPEMGDFPCVLGDQAVYLIFNDTRVNFDGMPSTDSMKLEIHLMAYEYITNSDVNNTVFLNYKIYNRSNVSYSDFYAGLYVDADLGCSSDDYVGSDSSLNSYFFYNGDLNDEDCNGLLGYGTAVPACGLTFLNQKMNSFMFYERGIGPKGDPNTAGEFYNYLTAHWRDGSHLTYGMDGYMGTTDVNYMFPGDPADTNQWSDAKVNLPFDRSGIGASGPYDLDPGSAIELDIAVFYTLPQNPVNISDAVDHLKSVIPVVQDFYDTRVSCDYAVGISENSKMQDLQLYPNPTNNLLYIQYGNELPDRISIINVLGEQIISLNSPVKTLDVSSLQPGIYFAVFDWGVSYTTKRISIYR